MTPSNSDSRAILLIHCPDQKGIIARVTNFLSENNGNIVDLDEHVDTEHKTFFMRVEWDLSHFKIPVDQINKEFGQLIGNQYQMNWNLHITDKVPRMAVFVSKLSHCLYDILSRYQYGEWKVEIPLIISNHQVLEDVAHRFGIDFQHFPIDKNNKPEQEQRQLQMLKDYKIDFIVLARYMQIVSTEFISNYPNKIINIHHSFLPAFPGARPYHSAYARGVKIIGASSHYVTAELDAGPIIEQEVVRVSHKDSVKTLVRKGQDLEKIVLSRAIWNHLERKILVFNNRTIIFE